MIISTKQRKHKTVVGEVLEQVTYFNYLGTIIEETGKVYREINQRVGRAGVPLDLSWRGISFTSRYTKK